MSDGEKKLFAGPLNSELRRRQSSDYLPLASPLRDRFGAMAIKRRDSTEPPAAASAPRRLSLSTSHSFSARDSAIPSPRSRQSATLDGLLNGSPVDVWRRRRDSLSKQSNPLLPESHDVIPDSKINEEDEDRPLDPSTSRLGIIQNLLEPPDVRLNTNPTQNGHHHSPSPADSAGQAIPQNALNLATVEWSYLDPQRKVQGPFQAELMQKWHDDGYFAPDLRVKRTTIDNDWITVAFLTRTATDPRIFFTPPAPLLPPGLPPMTPSNPPLSDPSVLMAPYQPSPIRSVQNHTLDSYLASMSNPSDSPASSLGRFGTDSPDPNAFGGRIASGFSSDAAIRPGNFSLASDASANFHGRIPYGDGSIGLGYPSVTGLSQGRSSSNDSFHYNPATTQPAWRSSSGQSLDMIPAGNAQSDVISYQPTFGHGTNFHQQQFLPDSNIVPSPVHAHSYTPRDYNAAANYDLRPPLNGVDDLSAYNNYGGLAAGNSAVPSLQGQVSNDQFVLSGQNMFDQPIVSAATRPVQNDQEPVSKVDTPWGTTNDASDARHAFDIPKPVSETNVTPSAWPQAATVSQAVADIDSSQWLPIGSDVPSSLADKEGFEPLTVSHVPILEQAITSEPAPEPVTETVPASTKSRAKPAPKQPAAPTAAQTVAPDLMSPVQKTAWARDSEQKNKPSGITLSLREIQQAEAKNVEARKAAEREKEKATRANSLTSGVKVGVEDVQFTGSWGLPTSQAGRSNANAQARDLTPTTPSPGPWTTGAKLGTKKTMKEIQEEEELRKKASAGSDVATAAAATKRGYSESASKPPASAPQGNAWTTVGPSGKAVNSPAVVSRPAATPSSVSTTTSISRPNGTAPTRTTTSTTVKSATKLDDTPVHPSHDFLKWLAEALRGLNNSVNVEEISSMLLTFPLDPDPSTMEIISDLIYANSTTLDGRRFAHEFVTKRKADATNRPKGTATGKPVSIADVVKSQPKPASSEWGGFKVVNKKKKGGRT